MLTGFGEREDGWRDWSIVSFVSGRSGARAGGESRLVGVWLVVVVWVCVGLV